MKKVLLVLLAVFMYTGVGAVVAKADTETICQTSNGYIEINNTTGALTSYTYGGPSGMFSNPISLDDAIDLCMQNEAAGVVYDSARLKYWTELITSMTKDEKVVKENTAELNQLNVLLTPTSLNSKVNALVMSNVLLAKTLKIRFGIVCTKFDYRPNGDTWITEVYTRGGDVYKRVYSRYNNPLNQPHEDGPITVVNAIKLCDLKGVK